MTRFTTFNFGTNSTPNKVVDFYTGPTTESDLLLGQTFFSTTKRQNPGLLYAGETYSWADNPKLKVLFDNEGHGFIINNGADFTVASHSDFIRAGTSNIGTHVNDTTAKNGLRFNTISGGNQVSGGVFASSATSNTSISGNQLTSKLQGDSETAPNHRRAYFGIYGDIAVITVQANLVPVEPLETLVGQAAASVGTTDINLDTTLDDLKANYKYLRLIGTTDKFGDPRTEEILVRTNQLVDGFDITMEFNGSLSTFNVDANAGGNVILNNQSANAGAQNLEVWAIKEPKTVVGSDVDILDEDDFASDRDDAVPSQQSIKAYVDTAIANIDAPELLDEDDFVSNDDTKAPTQQSTKEYVDEEIRKITTIGNSLYLPKDVQGNADYGVADFQEGDFDELVDGTYDYAGLYVDDADGNIGVIFVGTMNQAYRDVIPVSNYTSAEAFAVNKGDSYNGKLIFTEDTDAHYYLKDGQLFPLTKPETQPEIVNEETFNASNLTKTLLKNDPIYQYLKTDTNGTNVVFPTDAINGTKFVVRNDETSTKDLTINSVLCSPGETYEAIYTGTRWMEL